MLAYLAMLNTEDDQQRFHRLYEAYKGVMYHMACQVLGDTKDSEDVVQQAFIKIIDHFEQVKEPVSPATRAYVLIVTQNTAIDLYRHRQRYPMTELSEACDAPVQSEIEHLENASPVAAAIAQLPDRYRQVILLKYDYGLSNREIAKTLSITEANVRKLIQRAKERLERNLTEQGVVL